MARCTVRYSGRLDAYLPPATRLIMVKEDGCIAIHADGGAYKPLNWMNAPNVLVEEADGWRVSNAGGEQLNIELHEVFCDERHELGLDPGLVKDGVELHLQLLVAEHPEVIEPGAVLVRREYSTDIGPVDLLCRDAHGAALAVEIKRRGDIDGVEQLTRYLASLNRETNLAPVRGVLAAQEIKPQARTLARSRDITCVVLDYDDLRGLVPTHPRLF